MLRRRRLEDIFAIEDEFATSLTESLLHTVTPIKKTPTREVHACEF